MDFQPTVEMLKQFYTGWDIDDSNYRSSRSNYDRLFFNQFYSILFI